MPHYRMMVLTFSGCLLMLQINLGQAQSAKGGLLSPFPQTIKNSSWMLRRAGVTKSSNGNVGY